MVAPHVNLQNDCVCVPHATKKRQTDDNCLLCARPTFSKTATVSTVETKLRCIDLVFVEPGTKVDWAYYRNVVFWQQILRGIWQLGGDFYVFQQDNTLAHRASEMIDLLYQAITPDLWPANRQDLNPINHIIWGSACVPEAT